MPELTVENLFDTAYAATVAGIQDAGFSPDEPWGKLLPDLRRVVGKRHFQEAHEPALKALRDQLASAVNKGGKEGDLLSKGAASGAGPALADAAVQRSAALKLLRHTYLLREVGNQAIWIVSLPKSYSGWPDRYLKGTAAELVARLNDADEQFSADDRKHISDAAQTGLKWVLKAQVALDDLGASSPGLALLKRWFADEDTTDDMLRTWGGALKAGLKKIAAKLGAGSVTVTDFVPIRHSPDASDKGFLKANAFVWVDKSDVIYVEPAFFVRNAKNVFLDDAKHWARIVVHEMTHRVMATEDKRYGHAGLKPSKAVLPHASAIVNADSCAIFVADAAGAMEDAVRSRALNGT